MINSVDSDFLRCIIVLSGGKPQSNHCISRQNYCIFEEKNIKNLFKKSTAITLCLTTAMLIGSPAYAADDTQEDSFLSDIKNSISDFLPDEYDLSDFDLSNFSLNNFGLDNFSLDGVLNSTPSDAIPEIPFDEIIATPSDALPATPSDADDGWDDDWDDDSENQELSYIELVQSAASLGATTMSEGAKLLLMSPIVILFLPVLFLIPPIGAVALGAPFVSLYLMFTGLLYFVGSPIIALFAA